MGGVESRLVALHSEELSLHCCLVCLLPEQCLRLSRSWAYWASGQNPGHKGGAALQPS